MPGLPGDLGSAGTQIDNLSACVGGESGGAGQGSNGGVAGGPQVSAGGGGAAGAVGQAGMVRLSFKVTGPSGTAQPVPSLSVVSLMALTCVVGLLGWRRRFRA